MEMQVVWFALFLSSCFWSINGMLYEDDFVDPTDLVNYDAVSKTMKKNTELIYSILKNHLQRTLDEIQHLSVHADMEKSKFLEAQHLTEISKLLEDKDLDLDPISLERDLKKVLVLHKENIDSIWKRRIEDLALVVLQNTFMHADMKKSKFLEAQQLTEISKLLEDKDLDLDPASLETDLKKVLVLHKENIASIWKRRIEDLALVVLQNTFMLEDHEEYRVNASVLISEAGSFISKFLEDNAWEPETLEKNLKRVLLQLKKLEISIWEKKYDLALKKELEDGFLTPLIAFINKGLGHPDVLSCVGLFAVLTLLISMIYAMMWCIQQPPWYREERPIVDDQPGVEEPINHNDIHDENILPDVGNQAPQNEPRDSLTSQLPLSKQETQPNLYPETPNLHRDASPRSAQKSEPKPLKSEKQRDHQCGFSSGITSSAMDGNMQGDSALRERKRSKDTKEQKTKCYGDASTSNATHKTEPNQLLKEMDHGNQSRPDVEDIGFSILSDEQEDHVPDEMKSKGGTPTQKPECSNSRRAHDDEAKSLMSQKYHEDQSECSAVVSSTVSQLNQQCDNVSAQIKNNSHTGASRSDTLDLRSMEDVKSISLQSNMDPGKPLEYNSHISCNSYVTSFPSVPDRQDDDGPAELRMRSISDDAVLRHHNPINTFSSGQKSDDLETQSFVVIEESRLFSTDTLDNENICSQ